MTKCSSLIWKEGMNQSPKTYYNSNTNEIAGLRLGHVCVDNKGSGSCGLIRFHHSCCVLKIILMNVILQKMSLCKTISLVMMPFKFSSSFIFLLLCPDVWSYEAPEDKQDMFAARACPAFLTFTNAAYLAGATVELPCRCKPQQVANKQQLLQILYIIPCSFHPPQLLHAVRLTWLVISITPHNNTIFDIIILL